LRTYNLDKIEKAVSQYSEEIVGFNPLKWVSNLNNVALINNNDDVALFERQYLNPKSVCGHYFFFSRGKKALIAAKEFLKEIFKDEYDIEIILGLTPTDHKGALWMNKQLGFKNQDIIEGVTGPVQLVMMTKQQWKEDNV